MYWARPSPGTNMPNLQKPQPSSFPTLSHVVVPSLDPAATPTPPTSSSTVDRYPNSSLTSGRARRYPASWRTLPCRNPCSSSMSAPPAAPANQPSSSLAVAQAPPRLPQRSARPSAPWNHGTLHPTVVHAPPRCPCPPPHQPIGPLLAGRGPSSSLTSGCT